MRNQHLISAGKGLLSMSHQRGFDEVMIVNPTDLNQGATLMQFQYGEPPYGYYGEPYYGEPYVGEPYYGEPYVGEP
jgi:hypothetical protein